MVEGDKKGGAGTRPLLLIMFGTFVDPGKTPSSTADADADALSCLTRADALAAVRVLATVHTRGSARRRADTIATVAPAALLIRGAHLAGEEAHRATFIDLAITIIVNAVAKLRRALLAALVDLSIAIVVLSIT